MLSGAKRRSNLELMHGLDTTAVETLLRAFGTYRLWPREKIDDLVTRCWVAMWSVVGDKILAQPPATAAGRRGKRREGLKVDDFGAFTVGATGQRVALLVDAAFLARLGAK